MYELVRKRSNIIFLGTTDLMKPSQVFVRQNDPTLSPQLSDHGSNSRGSMNQFDTSGLIDYVDFGPDANSFLLDIGVCPAPSASMLAELLLDRQANFFQNSGSQDQTKIRVYLHCLTMLATQIDKNVPILTRPLERRLRNEPWCLGCQYRPKNTNTNTYQIVNPKEIYLVDDVNFANDFQPLCPPDNQRSLSVLYEKFGSQWLSKCVRCELANLGTQKRAS